MVTDGLVKILPVKNGPAQSANRRIAIARDRLENLRKILGIRHLPTHAFDFKLIAASQL
jgi:hypothetical protein